MAPHDSVVRIPRKCVIIVCFTFVKRIECYITNSSVTFSERGFGSISKIIDTFGFDPPFWSWSGMKGIHATVAGLRAGELDDEQRMAIAKMLNIFNVLYTT